MGGNVGHPMVRVDSLTKVSDQACYAADISLSGMLYGRMLGSPFAHAAKGLCHNIEKSDFSETGRGGWVEKV